MRRRGFTLVEVMVALTITALVASVAWTSLAAGIETGDRMRDAREGSEAEATVRTLLVDALRHAVAGTSGSDSVFVLDVGPHAGPARLAFQSRGIVPPLGGSATWSVVVETTSQGLVVAAVPLHGDAAPVRAMLPSVRGLLVATASRQSPDEWRSHWPAGDTPGRIALTLLDAGGRALGPAIVSRVSLEAWR